MGFEQASIPIEKEREFAQLREAITAAFDPGRVEKFLAALKSTSVRVRDFDSVLAKKVLETATQHLQKQGTTAQALYNALTVSDQGQMREFYLVQVEQIAPELRRKFHHVYRDF